MPKYTHILNAASNLLGISLVIIAALNVSRWSERTIADEIAWVAAMCLSLSCVLSYFALRAEPRKTKFESWADPIFLIGLLTLFASVAILALFSNGEPLAGAAPSLVP